MYEWCGRIPSTIYISDKWNVGIKFRILGSLRVQQPKILTKKIPFSYKNPFICNLFYFQYYHYYCKSVFKLLNVRIVNILLKTFLSCDKIASMNYSGGNGEKEMRRCLCNLCYTLWRKNILNLPNIHWKIKNLVVDELTLPKLVLV